MFTWAEACLVRASHSETTQVCQASGILGSHLLHCYLMNSLWERYLVHLRKNLTETEAFWIDLSYLTHQHISLLNILLLIKLERKYQSTNTELGWFGQSTPDARRGQNLLEDQMVPESAWFHCRALEDGRLPLLKYKTGKM